MTLGQALVLTQCLRLNPAERPTAHELLLTLTTNTARRFDPAKTASLLPVFAKLQSSLQAAAVKAQSSNSMPVSLTIPHQHLLDGKRFAPGQAAPDFKASPFRGVDDKGHVIEVGRKERIRTLFGLTVMVRCVQSAASKSASFASRTFRVTDTLLMAVELFDRLMSPAVLKRMRSMTQSSLESVVVNGKSLKSFLTDRLTDDSWVFERRDLQIVALYTADLLLHFDGQSLRRVIYTAYPRKCNIFAAECPSEAHDALWSVKSDLVVQWSLEALRSLNFDVVDASLLRTLERRGGVHRHRETVLGLFKLLETVPAQAVDVERVVPHDKPIDWGFGAAAGTDGTRGLFDVDF